MSVIGTKISQKISEHMSAIFFTRKIVEKCQNNFRQSFEPEKTLKMSERSAIFFIPQNSQKMSGEDVRNFPEKMSEGLLSFFIPQKCQQKMSAIFPKNPQNSKKHPSKIDFSFE